MDDHKYYPDKIEGKWQKEWEEKGTFSPDVLNASNPDYEGSSQKGSKQPFYNLMMFPYPSAEGLHVGNMYAFTGADIYAKFNRMEGKDVLEPIGLDGFGIHSENYALKIGKHPKEQADISEKNFYRQLRSIGNSFDWRRTVETYNPDYYKWTQWLFAVMFKNGLVYRDKALVNWCPKDLTVLSDEQVIDGSCERCGTKVEKRELEQWFFRITKYSERLLKNINGLNWTEKVKIAQRNWIGKSEGAEIRFRVEGLGDSFELKIFTTRPDTLFGATFMVVAPEHEVVASLLSSKFKVESSKIEEIKEYVEQGTKKTEIERTAEGKEKTGVDTGLKAINPVNGEKIPVWVADYVLSSYGTGAIMAVPAHDERDFTFAKKYGLPIVEVIAREEKQSYKEIAASQAPQNDNQKEAYIGPGKLINSGEWDGFEVPKDMDKVLNWLEEKGLGTRKANYHLRDWLISRQRYWGPPIPLIFCENCAEKGQSWFTVNVTTSDSAAVSEIDSLQAPPNDKEWNSAGWFPVPDDQLPVLLPLVSDWKPMGTPLRQGFEGRAVKSPLANHPEFYKTKCPNCGEDAVRETDVSDTFLDSSWYFLRYPSIPTGPVVAPPPSDVLDSQSSSAGARQGSPSASHPSSDEENLPFDMEITKKWLPVDQYIGGAEHSVLHLLYSRFVTMALKDMGYLEFEEPFTNFFAHGLIIKDGVKMSKSKGNVVVPDEYIGKYGADTLRTYLMFIGPYSEGGDFRDSGIEGMYKFLRKVWKMMIDASEGKVWEENLRFMHKTIKGVTEDIRDFGYNTAIAKLMEWYNFLNSEVKSRESGVTRDEAEIYLKLLAPFAPHMTEELYQKLEFRSQNSEFDSIHLSRWPEFEEKYLVLGTMIIVVQVNGKRRAQLEVQKEKIKEQKEIEKMAYEAVSKQLEGTEVKKVVYVPGKIINFVIQSRLHILKARV